MDVETFRHHPSVVLTWRVGPTFHVAAVESPDVRESCLLFFPPGAPPHPVVEVVRLPGNEPDS